MKKLCGRFLTVAFIIIICAATVSAATLVPGGQVIGLQLEDDTVTVAGFDQVLGGAAKSAGMASGDFSRRRTSAPRACRRRRAARPERPAPMTAILRRESSKDMVCLSAV